MEANSSTSESRQFRLGELFAWFIYFAAFFTVIGSYATITNAVLDKPVPPAHLISPSVGWLILLVYFVRKRHYPALVVHIIPGLFLVAVLLLVRFPPKGAILVALAGGWVATFFSFPISLFQSFGGGLKRELSPRHYLAFNLGVAVLLTTAFCTVVPTWMRGILHWPSAVYGALLGIWIGWEVTP